VLIAATRRRIKQAVGQRLRAHRLAPQQFWLLVAIHEREGLSLRELAETRHVDQPTACRVVMALARKGLVRAEGDPNDRRRSSLRLTAQGEALARKVLPLALEVRRAIDGALTPAERTVARRALRKVMASMDRFEAAARTR
jgi:DNA-binding MarR family transcriptional regulator